MRTLLPEPLMENDMEILEKNKKLKARIVGSDTYGIDIPIGAYIIDVSIPRNLYNTVVTGNIKILTQAYHDVTDEFINRKNSETIPPTSENLFKIMAIVRNFQIAQNPTEEKNGNIKS